MGKKRKASRRKSTPAAQDSQQLKKRRTAEPSLGLRSEHEHEHEHEQNSEGHSAILEEGGQGQPAENGEEEEGEQSGEVVTPSSNVEVAPSAAGGAEDEEGGQASKAAEEDQETILARCRRRIPYQLEQMILLVGEGNFSFAHALATVLRAGSNIVATSLDTLEECKEKYKDCEQHIKAFEKLGGTVLHKVDGTKLNATKAIRDKTFDVIVFNFPHAGKGIKDQARNIAVNRELLSKFFASAAPKLKKKGEIHVTLRTGLPYAKWNVMALAEHSGLLSLKKTTEFDPLNFPGYAHRNTIGFFMGVSKDFNQELTKQNCKTFIFASKQEMDKAREDQAKAKEAKFKATLGRGKKRKMQEAARKKKALGGGGPLGRKRKK